MAPASRGDPARASGRAGDRRGVTRHACRTRSGPSPRPSSTADRRAPHEGAAPGPGRRTACRVRCIPARAGAERGRAERVGRGVTSLRARARVRAPELHGAGGWLNTGGRPLTLADLRGRIVLLDFWTFCCVNCLHVIEELRPLEERYADVLAVVGVHSPKFPHEADHAALAAAVERYELHHPVLDDPELHTWQQYAVRAWPTLVVDRPGGLRRLVAAGRGPRRRAGPADRRAGGRVPRPAAPSAPALARTCRDARATHRPALPRRCRRHPGRHAAGRRHRPPLAGRAGAGRRDRCCAGSAPASAAVPTAARTRPASPSRRASPCCPPRSPPPPAMTSWSRTPPTTWSAASGSPTAGSARSPTCPPRWPSVSTVTGPVPPVPSPWDVAWWDGRLVVAAAGVHLLLGVDLDTGGVEILAGTTVEGLKDGPAARRLARPAQRAGRGRRPALDRRRGDLRAALAGAGRRRLHARTPPPARACSTSGTVDGPAATARFQHPLGVTALPDGGVAVLDTYNGAVRRYDPATDTVSTLATDLAEPAAAVLDRRRPGGGRVRRAPAHPSDRAGHHARGDRAGPPHRAAADRRRARAAGPDRRLRAGARPAAGRPLRPGHPAEVSASPPELLRDGAGESVELTRRLVRPTASEGVLHVTAQAASCDEGAEHPACHVSPAGLGPCRSGSGPAPRPAHAHAARARPRPG